MYYNTTNVNGDQLNLFTKIAKSQDEKVLEIFKSGKLLSPEDVWKMIDGALLTSIRRSISNLTKQGFLIKTDQTKIGIYKRPVYLWKVIP